MENVIFRPVAPESGTLIVPRERAVATARALLVGEHPWVRGAPMDLPVPTLDGWEDAARERCACEECGGDADGRVMGPCWRPAATLHEGVVMWSPWSGERPRHITVDTVSGEIRWSAKRRSTFVGGLLVAAAGGLSETPCRMEARP